MRARSIASCSLLGLALFAGRAHGDEAPPPPPASTPAAAPAGAAKPAASTRPWTSRPIVIGLIAALFLVVAGAAGANDRLKGDKKTGGSTPPAS